MEHGIDPAKVRQKVGFLSFKPVLNEKPRPGHVEEIKASLREGMGV